MNFFAPLLLAFASVAGQMPVTTSQCDNARTGANLHETVLNPGNVNQRQFGKLFSFAVDGDVYAQPLYVPALSIPGKATHDVLFVATEHDSVYAFDAAGNRAQPLWTASFTDSAKGITPVPAQAVGCPFIEPEVGITPTPVIDAGTNTLYVLARTREADSSGEAHYWQRLHALDLATGTEKYGGPVIIRASVETENGGLLGLLHSRVEFLALHENPRAALLLSQGKVYLTWASSCDVPPYHGWVMAYDSRTLKQISAFLTSPDATQSGIWQSDTGPAADEQGNVYVSTGNGVFDAAKGGHDYGDSLLKLGFTGSALMVKDYFTPFNEAQLSREDADLGSGGPVLIPPPSPNGPRLVVVGGKGGVIYVLNRERMGKFHAGSDANAIQTISLQKSIKSAPAYWNGHLFYIAGDDVLRDFAVQADGRLQPACVSKADVREPGATPAVSANNKRDGIVWFIETKIWNGNDRAATLHAYEAANVAHELYNSDQDRTRDLAGTARRFNIPTVANGRVYVGASGAVDVYGLLPGAPESKAALKSRRTPRP